MKTTLVLFSLILASSSFAAWENTPAQTACMEVFKKINGAHAKAFIPLIKRLQEEKRITDDALSELDRINTPTVEILRNMYSACMNKDIDLEQVQLLEATFLPKETSSTKLEKEAADLKAQGDELNRRREALEAEIESHKAQHEEANQIAEEIKESLNTAK